METVLEVDDLRMHYHTSKGPVRAIDGVSFRLGAGETIGLVGESGCGKTSIGTSIMRMPAPPGRYEGGRVLVGGTDILPLPEREVRRDYRWEKVSMVFQGAMNCLTPVYTIGRQMAETIRHHREIGKAESDALIRESLGHVGLPPEVAGRYPHELSGGMKQRVVIAMALFLKPRAVILDEPTTALDVIVQAQIVNLLKELREAFGLSYVFITHDLALEAEIADRIVVMYAGKIAESGPIGKVFGESAHPYTEKLLASTPRLRRKVEKLSFIPGTPPDLVSPPRGGRFEPRCPAAMERCREEEPPLLDLGDGRSAACWRCAR